MSKTNQCLHWNHNLPEGVKQSVKCLLTLYSYIYNNASINISVTCAPGTAPSQHTTPWEDAAVHARVEGSSPYPNVQ